MLWGCFCADGLVSQKQGTYLGLFSAKVVLGWPRNYGGTARSGSMHDREGGLLQGSWGGELRGRLGAPLHQMPDAALTNGSVLSMHRRGQAGEKPERGCGGFTVRRPDKQALGRQSTNEVNREMLLLLLVPP